MGFLWWLWVAPVQSLRGPMRSRRGSGDGGPGSSSNNQEWSEGAPSPPRTPTAASFSGSGDGDSRTARRMPIMGKVLLHPSAPPSGPAAPREAWLSQRDACVEVLSDAGPEGLTVRIPRFSNTVCCAVKTVVGGRCFGGIPESDIFGIWTYKSECHNFEFTFLFSVEK